MDREKEKCLDDHSVLGGIGCKKVIDHAGTHAWWGYMNGSAYTFISWGRRPT